MHNTTEAFLEFLDPTAKGFTFQYYPDLKNLNSNAGIRHGRLTDVESFLSSKNRGHSAIGVCINETDAKGRTDENVTKIRAVWHDDDHGYIANGGEFPLEPSLTVETSPERFHHYWIADPDSSGLSFDEFDAIMGIMVDEYNSDPAAKSRCQALRLVGSKNWKSYPDSFTVRIVGGSGKRYSGKDVLDAFGLADAIETVEDEESVAKEEIESHQHGPDIERLKSALEYLSSDEYADWFKYGAAIFDEFEGSKEGFEIWDEWSKRTESENYSSPDNRRHWVREFPKRTGRASRVSIATIFHDAIANGWKDSPALPFFEMPEGQDVSPFKGTKFDDDEFADSVIDAVGEKFSGWDHRPTSDDWEGLSDITKAYHRMAGNALGPAYFLSSLPPGMGKTTVITESTRALLSWPDYQTASVIYFMSRIEEINTLVAHMGLSDDDFGVFVSDSRKSDVKSIGNPNIGNARVLFTTQQMLERRSIGKSFGEIEEFFYKGNPRNIRIWDETIAPTKSITLTNFGIGRLLEGLRASGHWKMASELFDWAYQLKGSKSGDIVEVPDVSVSIASIADFRDMFADTKDKDRAEALFTMAGRSVRVRKDNLDGTTALEYQDILPEDLGPMLILDASGGLRKTYSFWEGHRGGLHRLKSPAKRYGNLTIHHMDRGSGKTLYKKDASKVREIAEAVTMTINADLPSDDPVLIIHPLKENKNSPDVQRLIMERLNPNRKGEVHFLNWGRHTATNEFAHVKHVFLISILQYNEAQYEAIGRGAKKSSFDEPFLDADYESVRFGEIAHNILQAACRGTVRRSFEGDCPPGCNLYVIFPTNKKGFSREGLSRIFPGATIKDWASSKNEEAKLTGNALKVYDAVMQTATGAESIAVSEVMDVSGIRDKTNFSKIVQRPDIQEALRMKGIEYQKGIGRSVPMFRNKRYLPFIAQTAKQKLPF
ncbi:hypothetical protein G6M85_03050 [Agrobacterium tumefaciens]|jgi:hypothetical protein|uniref:PriCT-2 domain-containing protein n=1 Tax=Agrobacterium tumefaciens TaxID=358 RepID=UPI000DD02DF0|nr:PriCT-2 domain-containing protein [Agrobacterium tumefaciens]NTE64587.1 hypothetical protein [Agrobacterium tumefaciens]